MNRANTADDNHNKGEDQNRLTHPDLNRLDRANQRTRQSRKCRAKGKNKCIQQRDINPERTNHFAVVLTGPNSDAYTRARDHPKQTSRNHEACNNNGQPVDRIFNSKRQHHRTRKPLRFIKKQRK